MSGTARLQRWIPTDRITTGQGGLGLAAQLTRVMGSSWLVV